MLCEQREAEQEPQQVGERDPFVREVQREAVEARARRETRDRELVQDDNAEARKRDVQRVPMEQRDAGEHEPEQHEVEGCSERCRGAADDERTDEKPALMLEEA